MDLLSPLGENKEQVLQCMLWELQNNRLEVALVPAPEPKFEGHKIRVAISQNCDWFRWYFKETGGKARRKDCATALKKLIAGFTPKEGSVAGDLDQLSEALIGIDDELAFRMQEDDEEAPF